VTSLVGRYMGAKDPELAVRSTYSALKVAWCFSLFMTCLFVFVPHILVGWFASDKLGAEYKDVLPLAATMLRIAAVYTLFDSTFLVFSGALRGAGDTKWALWVSVGIHWFMATVCITLIYTRTGTPVGVWCVFALLIGTLATTFYLRFRGGRWKTLSVLDEK
jgi:MATE family multidrug resistance protein